MHEVDVLVIGGGAAGLSGALTLGRARRSVLVVDAGEPRNAPAAHMHGFLGHDGLPPADLLARGRAEVEGYGVRLHHGRVTAAVPEGNGFLATLDGGAEVRARRVLVATGLVDELPEVDGLRARWGRDVVHCPYCHGWEVRDRRIVLLGSMHQALLWRNWTAALTWVTPTTPEADDRAKLAALGITVVEDAPAEVLVEADAVTGIRLASGRVLEAEVIATGAPMRPRLDGLDGLGLVAEEGPFPGSSFLPTGDRGQTVVPGVRAAGNVTDLSAQVVVAAAEGQMAAAMLNMELIEEDTTRAMHRPPTGRDYWEDRYAGTERVWSGRPNRVLETEAATLTPGTAADIGAGEGGDAVWLATRGWDVTAVDIAQGALDKVAALAAEQGVAVRTERADVGEWDDGRRYDLVTSHFLHPEPGIRDDLFRRMAAAVAPGGTLLIVGHHPHDRHLRDGLGALEDWFVTAEQVAALLDPDEWQIEVAESRPRTEEHAGRQHEVADAVLRARRRG
ncbi:bifunctional NAD(P)/FAD-dependent oxidoreductase/class I SAM-dependent methyltransferase [Cellulomonas taurus]|uniref:bifunctional NAD(P)/FAD-dependent oxidoreductase/class I SAM-dependent methyltransferase n=1 Tax=Cellulomonas taurus TaxID=2729175 RepID=UPI00145D3CED|nr:bifunctional NAD(P)/FAD-dependent oxidoreductase/class I SAM-dependent methyltransferase [Cellulomonas taurus]